jgi:hypothetical protein
LLSDYFFAGAFAGVLAGVLASLAGSVLAGSEAAGAGAVSSGVEEQYPKLMIKTTSNEAITFFIKFSLMVLRYYFFCRHLNQLNFNPKESFISGFIPQN